MIHYTCNIDLFRKSISGINFPSLATQPSMCEWLDIRVFNTLIKGSNPIQTNFKFDIINIFIVNVN